MPMAAGLAPDDAVPVNPDQQRKEKLEVPVHTHGLEGLRVVQRF